MSKKVHELEARLEDQQVHHTSIFELEAQLTEKNKSIRVLKQRLGDMKKTLQRERRYTGGQSFDGSGNVSEGESLAGGNSTFPSAPIIDISAEGGKMEKSYPFKQMKSPQQQEEDTNCESIFLEGFGFESEDEDEEDCEGNKTSYNNDDIATITDVKSVLGVEDTDFLNNHDSENNHELESAPMLRRSTRY
ncbi:uncharacterized protein LOC124165792 [Ischnura elegans]|uniref:uncharacterized protein LOC124165792 n=1 Tax=Ischnura elegans TaxID=197161 RepID=UPI001ED8B58E|nr:uncharacterized protein LOC124165792 [Ischnura elegans]